VHDVIQGAGMGLFKKLKQGLGMGTVKVAVSVPAQVSAGGGPIEGSMTITAESDQKILSVSAVFERVFSYTKLSSYTDSDGNTHDTWSDNTHRETLATWEDTTGFAMAEGEAKQFAFSLAYAPMEETYSTGLGSKLWTFLPSNWMPGKDYMGGDIVYVVRAVVDIADAAFDKEDEQVVQVG